MAKTITTNLEEIIPRPVLNISTSPGVWSASKPIPQSLSSKKIFTLKDKDEKNVAALIDRGLAEKWVADNTKGAVKFSECIIDIAV